MHTINVDAMLTRRNFIRESFIACAGLCVLPEHLLMNPDKEMVMTVNGPISLAQMQFTLSHEHVLCDFIGVEKYIAGRSTMQMRFMTGHFLF